MVSAGRALFAPLANAVLIPLVKTLVLAHTPVEAMDGVADHEVSRLVWSFPGIVLEGHSVPLSLRFELFLLFDHFLILLVGLLVELNSRFFELLA